MRRKPISKRRKYQFGNLELEPRKKGPPVWTLRWRGPKNAAGRRTRTKIVLGTVTELPQEQDAWLAAERYRVSLNREAVPPERITMTGLLDRYVHEVLPQPQPPQQALGEPDYDEAVSQHCARSYRSVIKKWIRPRWAEVRDERTGELRQIYCVRDFASVEMAAALESWLKSLLRSRENPRGLARKTVREIFNVLKQLFKYARKWGYIDRNPLGDKFDKLVELPRGSTKRQQRPRSLTPAEYLSVLKLFGVRERLALTLAGSLGLRVSEIFGLQWQDLDLATRKVSFRRGFVFGQITPLKTEASRTDLPLSGEVVALLEAWRRQTPYRSPGDWVFASSQTRGRRPLWPGNLMRSYIRPAAEKAGLGRLGWHTFRHSYSSWGKESGLAAPELKQLLRHETSKTTMELYGDTELEAKRRDSERILRYVKREARRSRPAQTEAKRSELALASLRPVTGTLQ